MRDLKDNPAPKGRQIVREIPIATESTKDMCFVLDATVYIDDADRLGAGDAAEMRLEAVCEAYAEDVRARLNLGTKMLEAARSLPETITQAEIDLILKLEAEVDAAFGHNTHLYGRAVALFAIRDLAGG